MAEIWAAVHGYEGLYEVSTWGRVRNSQSKILTQHPNQKGYLRVTLVKNGKSVLARVHRLVAQTFIPNPNHLPQVNHIDLNNQNNSVTNLEWVDGYTNAYHNVLFTKKIEKQIQECLTGDDNAKISCLQLRLS